MFRAGWWQTGHEGWKQGTALSANRNMFWHENVVYCGHIDRCTPDDEECQKFSGVLKVPTLVRRDIWTSSKKEAPPTIGMTPAIERLELVYQFDQECVNNVKLVTGTHGETQGPQGTFSSVVIEDERRLLKSLREIKVLLDRFSPGSTTLTFQNYVPQRQIS